MIVNKSMSGHVCAVRAVLSFFLKRFEPFNYIFIFAAARKREFPTMWREACYPSLPFYRLARQGIAKEGGKPRAFFV
jgi:hypothetical protein